MLSTLPPGSDKMSTQLSNDWEPLVELTCSSKKTGELILSSEGSVVACLLSLLHEYLGMGDFVLMSL